MRRSTTSCCSGVLLALAACRAPSGADSATTPTSCDSAEHSRVGVVSAIAWGRAADDGTSLGFDLDGIVSTSTDPRGCKIADYVSPEGVPGIDNGFARVLPALDLTEAVAVEGLIAQSIAAGDLLISLELTGVDDPVDDDCVGLTIGRATGDVLLGTDGTLEPGQTFDHDADLPSVHFDGLSIVDGRVLASPLDWSLPLQIFDVSLDFELTGGTIQIDLDPEGGMTGVIGGAVSTDYIVDVAGSENVDPSLVGIVSSLLDATADLNPDTDGVCQDISVNLEYQAIDAWFYED